MMIRTYTLRVSHWASLTFCQHALQDRLFTRMMVVVVVVVTNPTLTRYLLPNLLSLALTLKRILLRSLPIELTYLHFTSVRLRALVTDLFSSHPLALLDPSHVVLHLAQPDLQFLHERIASLTVCHASLRQEGLPGGKVRR